VAFPAFLMLDLTQYDSIGAALRDALDRWPDEVCLIEADRDQERSRLTYGQFREAAAPLAAALEESGFAAGDRAAIIMTNQPKWLSSAYAIFFAGGVLVPLDFMLKADDHLRLLAHSKPRILIIEYWLWRNMTPAEAFSEMKVQTILVTEAPPDADLKGGMRWEDFRGTRAPEFRPRARQDTACIVYSSGTGGHPKGCVLTHENYLEQCRLWPTAYPFRPGVRYLSILPTNHAFGFMVGFFGPFVCGATVVHLRSLKPDYIREAFTRYKITYMGLVPLALQNLRKGLEARFAELPSFQRKLLDALVAVNKRLTRRRPNLALSRRLLKSVHSRFGGELRALFVGGAFTESQTLQFFYDLGIPVANGYGLTEACTAVTINDVNPFRPETVGRPLPGMEVRIDQPDGEGIGEVAVRSKTVMSHYLDDPELTAETIVDGWLMTGDLGRVDAIGHLRLFGRRKNMIVTAEGKNVFPEDIENAFAGLPVKEFCVFAANYIWPQHTMTGEQLVLVLRAEPSHAVDGALRTDIARRNQQLLHFRRVSGYLMWNQEFPRPRKMEIGRRELAEQISQSVDRSAVVAL
jgi:long-chain acyl-CoA synthetase